MSYSAVVARITVRPHPNAERIQLATVRGYQVVVGLDARTGDLGVFFPTDGQLSQEMCDANDLISRIDEGGNRAGGFFSAKRRVRAQRFRGERSDGYWTPLESLSWTGFDVSSLEEGMTFTELNGKPVCNKYFTPATKNAMLRQRKDNPLFAKHVETRQLKYEYDRIPPDAVVWVTEKVHGSSARQASVPRRVERKRTFWQRLTRKPTEITLEYEFLVGSRNVILEEGTDKFYEDKNFRFKAAEPLRNNLFKGEAVYGELVGWTATGPIMGQHSTKKIKEYRKRYGDTITYTYGQVLGECELLVYRITRINEDGIAVDLSWPAVKARSAVLGLRTVPELAGPVVAADVDLVALAAQHESGPSTLCEAHPREGVVLRVDHENVEFYKQKNFEFGVMEGWAKTDDSYVDMEEAS